MNNRRIITVLVILSVLLNISYAVFAEEEKDINIALNQEAVASSYEQGHYAKDAIDGINDNEEYSYWKSAENDYSPWWQVDLGLDYKISKVIIESRKGETAESERNNFAIMVSNNADFSKYEQIAKVEQAYENEYSASVSGNKQYRYLRIAKLDNKPLSLAEVKIIVDKASIKQGEQAAINQGDDEEPESVYGRYDVLSDIVGTDKEEQVTLLQNLGIVNGYPDGTFKPENTITRAEFAAMIYNITANGMTEGSDSATFNDVPKEHWANQYIEYLYRNHLVNGVSESDFAPDHEITIQEAAKMIVSMLGKDIHAKNNGGYPDGYLYVANENGLFKNIAKSSILPTTRGEVAVMLYNALDVRVSSLEVNEKKISDTDTLLYAYMNIKKRTDLLTAVGNISINIDDLLANDGKIMVGGTQYQTEIPGLEKYLGYRVDLYYTDQDDETAYAVIPRKNSSQILQSDDIDSMNNSEITYRDGRLKKNINLPKQYYVVYNNRAVRNYDLQNLKPSYGTVKLVDHNTDGKYEVVIIENYISHVLAGISTNSSTLYLKNPTQTINYSSETVDFKYGKNHEPIEPEQIQEDMVATVMESYGEDDKIYTIIFSDERINGKVTGIENDDDKLYVTVNGTRYEALADRSEFESNMNGTFYLDVFGRIVALGNALASTERYGYLNLAYADEDTEVVQFKIFTQYGDFITAEAAKKLKIDGSEYQNAEDAVKRLKDAGKGSVYQVVRYKQNGKGEIVTIDTVLNDKETDGLKLEQASYSGMYGNQMFNMNLAINDNTVMFVIPDNKSEISQYGIKLKSELRASASYTFDVYDIDDNQIVGCCVFGEGDVDFNENANVVLVDKFYTTVAEDGELRQVLCGYSNNEYVELAENKEGVFDDLEQGDIISAALSLQGTVKQVLKRYYREPDHPGNSRAVSALNPSIGSISSNTSWKYGTVLSKKDGKVVVDVGGNKFVFNTKGETRLRMYYYDEENGEVGLAGYGDIRDAESVGENDASRVVVHPMYLETREVIILQ